MKRKLMSIVLAVAMLLHFVPTAMAAGHGEATVEAAPKVTIVAVNIDGNYLELGLSIESGTDEMGHILDFRSVGAVLQYNAEALQPCGWVNDDTGNPVAVSTEAAVNWDSSVALPTKAPDGINSKTALAYVDQTEKTGYLYVAAEAPKPYPLQQTVLSGVTEATVEQKGENGVGIGTVKALEEAATPLEQAVTVRFQFREKTPAQEGTPALLYTLAEAKLDLVMAGTAGTFDAADNTDVTTGGFAPAVQPLIYWGSALNPVNPITEDIATYNRVDKQLLLVQKGVSVNQGGGGPADSSSFFPITFYDWDGVTLLGTKIVAKVDNAAEQERLIQTAMDEMAKDFAASQEQLGERLWYDDPSKPLTYKKGYTFGKWIDFEAVDEAGNQVYTNYGTAVNVTNATSTVTLPEPQGHIYSVADQRSGITLKAAYVTNADMDALEDLATVRQYKVSYDSYLQFGSSSDVGITVNIKRENANGQGVPRVRELGLRVSMDVDMGEQGINKVYSLQTLENKDDITTRIAVNNKVAAVSVEVIDLCSVKSLGGTKNWASEAIQRSAKLTQQAGGDHTNKGFVLYGIVGFFNDVVENAFIGGDTGDHIRNNTSITGIHSIVSNAHYTKAGFDLTEVKGVTGGAAVKRRGALANIFEMYQSLPEPRRALEWEEMQEAITYGSTWSAEANGGAGGWVKK